MICVRICWFQGYQSSLLRQQPELHREWCSPRDLTQLLVKSIGADLPFAIFFGVSNNTGRYWDISNAQKLVGYQPQDDAVTFVRGGQ
jgi:uronate dehydrogenase